MTIEARFDEVIDRRGSGCDKWDMMEALFGVRSEDGLAMWVADMDFRPPDCVTDALRGLLDHGVFGYYGSDTSYRRAVQWWWQSRQGWEISPDWVLNAAGLVNGTALCVDTFSEPGDGVVLFTPVYHAFSRVITANDRRVVECPLTQVNGRYEMDFDAYETILDGSEKLVVLCSPHNPGGQVWTPTELGALAEFARRHDLIIVSDEIHNDLVYTGQRHTPMALIEGVADRLVMMGATTKTFNIAGAHLGNLIVSDDALRARLSKRIKGLGLSPNLFGYVMAEAAYSPQGADWLDDLVIYLEGNRRVFDDGVNAIPGLRSMPLQATYLSWVDFSGTGMPRTEFTERVEKRARIAANRGPTFGTGGENWMRFNIAMPRVRVQDAVERLQSAFSDLQ
ncbi:MAG: MalY/PatB family protein [Pseudomonadota bacterium]